VIAHLLALALATQAAAPPAPAPAPAKGRHTIYGAVRHAKTGEPLANALVVLQCTCIEGMRETQTNDAGVYRFRGLPSGVYTVQILVGGADVAKVVTLGRP
jgi:hypothetical protein